MRKSAISALLASVMLVAASCSGTTAHHRTATSNGRNGVTPTVSSAGATTPGTTNRHGDNQQSQGSIVGTTAPGNITGPGASTAGTGSLPGGATPSGTLPSYCAKDLPPIRLGYGVVDTTGVSEATGTGRNITNPADAVPAANAEMQALAAWANDTGGVGCRKILATGYDIKLTSTESELQADCVKITQDDHQQVFIDSYSFTWAQYWSCFANAHTDFVGLVQSTDEGYLRSVAPYVTGTWATVDRQMRAMPAALNSVGYFKGATVGVILDDTPTMRSVYQNDLVPALSAVGVHVRDARFFPPGYNVSNASNPAISNAAVSFNLEHINRVLDFVDNLIGLPFSEDAESQGYHPRYAFPDFLSAPADAEVFWSHNPDQLTSSVAVSSWESAGGVADNTSCNPNNPNPAACASYPNLPGAQQCNAILTQMRHINYSNPPANSTSGSQYMYCNNFFLWLDAARKLGAGWTPSSFGQGLQALGSSYSSAMQHAVDYSSGRNDGATAERVGLWNDGCNCFPAVSGWLRIPN